MNFSIKLKLILIFILIKVIPLVLISYIGIEGVLKLNNYFINETQSIYAKNEEVIKDTAYKSISDSIKVLDQKSQKLIEKQSVHIASNIASFLYERDRDIIFLSKLDLNQKILNDFYKSKYKKIKITPKFKYDNLKSTWIRKEEKKEIIVINNTKLVDNKKEFRNSRPVLQKTKNIPLYKEIVFFDLNGMEIYKKSSIDKNKNDISKKANTYIKSEKYFSEIKKLKEGDIYVSDVIGEYVSSKVIGKFTKEKAKKMNIEFNPSEHAFAGVENPIGKKFDGIIRFITPVFKNNKKIGFISLALDHNHIMEFTDTFNPNEHLEELDISDASLGNYAFMWDYKGRNISHPRDYFIIGYDSNTGEQVPGWLSKDIALDFKNSNKKNLSEFLKMYPTFKNQSLDKKPNLEQLKEKGQIGLDCRYLNFAPQCTGWMELTQDGGYGSFVILWSNVLKLTTAASIPYYSGKYSNSKRGFGFVTIGANVDEFHSSANKTKENIEEVIISQSEEMTNILNNDKKEIKKHITKLINELTIYTIIMIIIVLFIAVWMSNYISSKIYRLIEGTKEFSHNNLDYRIEKSSNDEIGTLEESFNDMAKQLKDDQLKIKEQDKLVAHQNKMAAMGEMLGNIAHQWRQPLSRISTSATGMKLQKEMDVLSDDDFNHTMDSINESAQYLSQTIDDFRGFFNPSNHSIKENEISSIVMKSLKLIDSQFTTNDIEIVKDIQNYKLLTIENELTQVLINILNNARDVLIAQPEIKKLIFINTYQKNNISYIEIIDNAGGINSNIIDRVFEPYFTTKHQSNGTGIGLYMSHDIVNNHLNGSLNVSNEDYIYKGKNYKGAKFTIKIDEN